MWPIFYLTIAFWSKFVRGGRIQAQKGSKIAREPPCFDVCGYKKEAPTIRPKAGRPEAGRPEAGRPKAGRPEAGRRMGLWDSSQVPLSWLTTVPNSRNWQKLCRIARTDWRSGIEQPERVTPIEG